MRKMFSLLCSFIFLLQTISLPVNAAVKKAKISLDRNDFGIDSVGQLIVSPGVIQPESGSAYAYGTIIVRTLTCPDGEVLSHELDVGGILPHKAPPSFVFVCSSSFGSELNVSFSEEAFSGGQRLHNLSTEISLPRAKVSVLDDYIGVNRSSTVDYSEEGSDDEVFDEIAELMGDDLGLGEAFEEISEIIDDDSGFDSAFDDSSSEISSTTNSSSNSSPVSSISPIFSPAPLSSGGSGGGSSGSASPSTVTNEADLEEELEPVSNQKVSLLFPNKLTKTEYIVFGVRASDFSRKFGSPINIMLSTYKPSLAPNDASAFLKREMPKAEFLAEGVIKEVDREIRKAFSEVKVSKADIKRLNKFVKIQKDSELFGKKNFSKVAAKVTATDIFINEDGTLSMEMEIDLPYRVVKYKKPFVKRFIQGKKKVKAAMKGRDTASKVLKENIQLSLPLTLELKENKLGLKSFTVNYEIIAP